MSRLPRKQLLYDGCYAHVFSASFDQVRIFRDDQDFKKFLSLLKTHKEKSAFLIHHYCLMHTHFHLVVSVHNVPVFSMALQRIKWTYTHWFNWKYRRKGPIWRSRFSSLIIEDERYLYACGLYVEYNPVKAGIVLNPENWIYSSSAYYFSKKPDALVDQTDYAFSKKSLPQDFDISNDDYFTKGNAIGSPTFRKKLGDSHQ